MNLLEMNRTDRERWQAILAENPGFRAMWLKDEWRSTCWLLDHTVERILGRVPGAGGRRVRVLDIGFGDGRALHRLIDYMAVPPELVTGIEVLPELLEAALARPETELWPKARLELVGPTMDDVIAWFTAEREAGRWYDLVIARHVFQFIPEPERMLAAIAGVLPAERLLAFVVPMPGWNLHETTAVTELPISWEGLIDDRNLSRGTPIEAATKHLYARDFKWDAGWAPMLQDYHMPPIEAGYFKSGSQYRGKESYAICRRAA